MTDQDDAEKWAENNYMVSARENMSDNLHVAKLLAKRAFLAGRERGPETKHPLYTEIETRRMKSIAKEVAREEFLSSVTKISAIARRVVKEEILLNEKRNGRQLSSTLEGIERSKSSFVPSEHPVDRIARNLKAEVIITPWNSNGAKATLKMKECGLEALYAIGENYHIAKDFLYRAIIGKEEK